MRDQTNQVHQALRQRILDGVFRPSESLTEVTLAAELGVNRATIRKALLKLESVWLRVASNPFGSSLLCLARKPG